MVILVGSVVLIGIWINTKRNKIIAWNASIRILFRLLRRLSIQVELILLQVLHVGIKSLSGLLAPAILLLLPIQALLLLLQALLFCKHFQLPLLFILCLLLLPVVVKVELRALQHLVEVSESVFSDSAHLPVRLIGHVLLVAACT